MSSSQSSHTAVAQAPPPPQPPKTLDDALQKLFDSTSSTLSDGEFSMCAIDIPRTLHKLYAVADLNFQTDLAENIFDIMTTCATCEQFEPFGAAMSALAGMASHMHRIASSSANKTATTGKATVVRPKTTPTRASPY